MKTSTTLFVSAFLFVILAPCFAVAVQLDVYERRGKDMAFLSNYVQRLRDTIDATGPTIERSVDVGFVKHLFVKGGVQLIHDEGMGDRAVANGPAAALDALSIRHSEGSYTFGFVRPVRLAQPVRIYLNLNRRLMKRLKIIFYPSESQRLDVSLVTKSTLKVPFLFIEGCYRIPKLDVEVDRLEFGGHCSHSEQASNTELRQLRGTVKHLFHFHLDKPFLRSPDAQIDKLELFSNIPSGQGPVTAWADTVLVRYTFDRIRQSDFEELPQVIDSVYVRPETVVQIHHESTGPPRDFSPYVSIIRR